MMPEEQKKSLPSHAEWDDVFPQLRPKLLQLLERKFSILNTEFDSVCDELFNEVHARIEKGKPFVKDTLDDYAKRLLTRVAKNRLPRTLPTREEWNDLYPQIQEKLLAGLRATFRSLGNDIGDVCQDVYVTICKTIDIQEPFLTGSLESYASWKAIKIATDRVRRNEPELLGANPGHEVEAPQFDPFDRIGSTPSARVTREAHVKQRNESLADIIRRLCHHWEGTQVKTSYDLTRRENFERMLRGQSADEIVEAALSRAKPGADDERPLNPRKAKSAIQDTQSDNLETLKEEKKKAKSAIQKTQSKCMDELVNELLYRDAGSLFATLAKALNLNQAEGNRQTKNLPKYVAHEEVLKRYLFEESGALCPREDRLHRCQGRRKSSWPRDIHYHVVEARCPLCLFLFGDDLRSAPRVPGLSVEPTP